ncbi:unnamed protein product [Rhodiola kirilowii]
MSEAEELSEFLRTGIYRLSNSSGVFVDPVRVLNRYYSTYQVSPSAYYSRFFQSGQQRQQQQQQTRPTATTSRKRKRPATEPRSHNLNQAETLAQLRHQEVRPLLVKAHESLLEAIDLLSVLPRLRNISSTSENLNVAGWNNLWLSLGHTGELPCSTSLLTFTQVGFTPPIMRSSSDATAPSSSDDRKVLPVFNNLIANDTTYDVEAEFLDHQYIIPRKSCFLMSDMVHINKLIPENSDSGFNLIVIDPPWENGSARQKSMYPTLPNKYFLSLPIKKLAHSEGALVALWVTNREKLRNFVERELFDKWEVKHVATYYWLKVKADGSLISELDLFHHRPYECLLLGYCYGDVGLYPYSSFKHIQDNVIISVPGGYSRKPPLAELLKEFVPGSKPEKCIELFAREMASGWTSWGNEPLHFQDSRYFSKNISEESYSLQCIS